MPRFIGPLTRKRLTRNIASTPEEAIGILRLINSNAIRADSSFINLSPSNFGPNEHGAWAKSLIELALVLFYAFNPIPKWSAISLVSNPHESNLNTW